MDKPSSPIPVRSPIRDLPPGIFAVVMATGIVSLAAHGGGLAWIASILFWLNVTQYILLVGMLAARCVLHSDAVIAELHQHARAPGFFTIVAGTCVLGNQFVLLAQIWQLGLALWLLGLLLWAGLTYSVLPGLMATATKPPLEAGLNGVWLLAVVATQAVSGLASLIAARAGEETAEPMLFLALIFWLVGGMLYIWLMGLIFYRCLFLPLSPADLTPPYWINMGAMAISTLAGVALIRDADQLALLTELLPFLKGLTLLFWATATWWIPMLLVLGAWRHIRQRFPLTYDHGYWAAVFPLGMYTVCTQNLIHVLSLPLLAFLPQVFLWLALGAWLLTFLGLLLHLFRAR